MIDAAALNATVRRLPVWLLYVAGLGPALWWWWLGLTGGLGVEPIRELEHRLGELGLQFLLAALLVTPIRRFLGINLLRFRRALGLLSFFHIVQHLAVWLVLDVGILGQVLADIVKRPYITVGMVAFVAMIPLAATSTDAAMRRLGPVRWRRLHRLTYLAAAAGALHYVLLAKGWQITPLLYLAATGLILAARVVPPRRVGAI